MKNFFLTAIVIFVSSAAFAQNLYFPPNTPNVWEEINPKSLGWCTAEIPALFSFLEKTNSKGFIVLKDGKIVIEKYFGSFTKDSLWYWASAGKSLTSALIGIAQSEGKLNISEPSSKYLGKNWTALPAEKEDMITIRHQLTMTSGLDDSVDKDCTNPSCLTYKADAGTRWAYHNGPYTLLDKVVEKSTGQTFNQFYSAKIRNKIGMNGLYIKSDFNNVNYSNLRSFARFGLLMLNNGKWINEQVVPLSYFKEATSTSQPLNQSYGYLWWLNGKKSYMLPSIQLVFNGSLLVEAPNDMYAALGKNGQIINIVPSMNLVVVRMGNSDGSPVPTTYNNEIWTYLLKVICTMTPVAEVGNIENATAVFPNPASERLYINRDLNCSEQEIQVFDSQGRYSTLSLNDNAVDISNLENGVYVIKLKTQNGFQMLKFTVLH